MATPRLWNNLPVDVRTAESIQLFAKKTQLFNLAFEAN